jgi:hypothetical protein
MGARVVVTQDFEESSVAGCAGVGHDYAVVRLPDSAHAAQPDFEHVVCVTPRENK